MANPMVFDEQSILINTELPKEGEKAKVSTKETEDYDYCFMGIKLTSEEVLALKNAMKPNTSFYVEIRFKNFIKGGEIETEFKFIHQSFDYETLVEQEEDLELLMSGWYELPENFAPTSVKVSGAKIFYVPAPIPE